MKDVDLILHAGDVLYHGPRNKIPKGYDPEKLSFVINRLPVDIFISKGNCDSCVDQMVIDVPIMSEYVFLSIEGFKIILHHGDKEIKFKNIDFYISGHTHLYNVDYFNSTLYINPGSISIPKNNPNGTCGFIDFSANFINIIDIKTGESLIETRF